MVTISEQQAIAYSFSGDTTDSSSILDIKGGKTGYFSILTDSISFFENWEPTGTWTVGDSLLQFHSFPSSKPWGYLLYKVQV
jgi:hypothetical protein